MVLAQLTRPLLEAAGVAAEERDDDEHDGSAAGQRSRERRRGRGGQRMVDKLHQNSYLVATVLWQPNRGRSWKAWMQLISSKINGRAISGH